MTSKTSRPGRTPAAWRRSIGLSALSLLILVAGMATAPFTASAAVSDDDDTAIAIRLAEMLRSARTVISGDQTLINDPGIADKGLTGDKVLADAIAIYQKKMGEDPRQTDPSSRLGQLLKAQMDAIAAVMDENQPTINAPGVGFKGFIPAIFARLVNERFVAAEGTVARVKVTAPEDLVRNRKARPDDWESGVISSDFAKADWPKGQAFSEVAEVDGKQAFRLLVPEYYAASCLSCHGEPKGETDITGYPKEGGHEGDLGAAISVILFK
jgi:hypothetical protein